MRNLLGPLFFSLILSLGLQARAFDIPSLTGPVVDQANLLSSGTKNRLSQLLVETKQSTQVQVQVLVVSSLQDLTIEEAAVQIFDAWKLGTKKEDKGVLFLIAPAEKKLRIEVGRGLEGDIPDAIAKRIVSDVVRPYFKRGEFNAGIEQGVQAILYYANHEAPVDDQQSQQGQVQEPESTKSGGSKYLILIVILLWVVLFIFNPSLAIALLFSGRGGRGGGGFGGGGGGWSGGGGGSAGGGASGDW